MNISELLAAPGRTILSGAPDGVDALALAQAAPGRTILHVATHDIRVPALAQALAFFAPSVEVLTFPSWDCMPYDRVSPRNGLVSQRMDTLGRLAAAPSAPAAGRIVLATASGVTQRVPPRSAVAGASFDIRKKATLDIAALTAYFARDGYARVGTVREPGEFAMRGGILDVFPPGREEPVRLDLFGDVLEGIRTFDPLTQRTTGEIESLELRAVSEILLDVASIARFRAAYGSRFGAVGDDDPLYTAISAGRRHAGAEQWLPLFHERVETLFDYLPGAAITLDHGLEDARQERMGLIAESYRVRSRARDEDDGVPYRPLPPDNLYLTNTEWDQALADRAVGQFSPFRMPPGPGAVDVGGVQGRNFAVERVASGPSAGGGLVLDTVRDHIAKQRAAGRRVIVAGYTAGSRDRLGTMLHEHGVDPLMAVREWSDALALPPEAVALAILPIEHGFEADSIAVLAEQDILGERMSRPGRRSRKAEDFLREVSALSPGDLVVHVDHGIGRFLGLETLNVQDRPHDCVALTYEDGDKLYIPVENIEVISRYGGDESEAILDRLGGSAWQARKARARNRIKEIAGDLLKVAAERALREAPKLVVAPGLYGEFCARFPYAETEDQERTIAEVLADMSSGRPMDRLVCGDVGFGKTEVALRAAFVAAMAGKQVAVVAPTTLLVRQHAKVFRERLSGWPIRINSLSRMVKGKEADETRRELADGRTDVIVGTHSLLAKSIQFKDLGLLIIDEEQRFGVTHKERLKELRANIHVLTLTATPIPRTLQMALAGIRELSLIATPPVDRLAVRTFILPFDAVVVREALLRERARGGQSFYVCPRVSDLAAAVEFIQHQVPGIPISVAHGRLTPTELEQVMGEFYDRKTEVLIATNIIESGLDIPSANTMIIHRADMFGLAELYQLRGRIGRSKVRGYAYLTTPAGRTPSAGAERRLRVMQALDELGAGFTLASHDLDIRGAGNLLGSEQSGHIKEVGFELYQRMLEEAVAAARTDVATETAAEEMWSPQINVGTAVLIPETYVADLDVRLGLYRRVAELHTDAEVQAFGAELIDRFGPLPEEVEHLLQIVTIKQLLRVAAVARLDAGPKGATVVFRNDQFANPAGLVQFIAAERGRAKLRPDQRLVFLAEWAREGHRLTGVRYLADRLARIATSADQATRPAEAKLIKQPARVPGR